MHHSYVIDRRKFSPFRQQDRASLAITFLRSVSEKWFGGMV